MEYLKAQKATTFVNNIANVVVTNDTTATTTVVDAIVVVETPVGIVIQLVISHPVFQAGPNRRVIAYPWRMPPNHTPKFANRSSFVLYQPFVVPLANGNSADFPWGMPAHHSPQVVDADNHETPHGQIHQTFGPVTVEIPDDT